MLVFILDNMTIDGDYLYRGMNKAKEGDKMVNKQDLFADYMSFQIGSMSRNLTKHFNNELSKYGITIGQVLVLSYLLEYGESPVQNIASGLKLESPAASRLVDRLIKGNLVSRHENEDDRRYMKIDLTDKGLKLANEVVAISYEFNKSLKEKFGEDDYYKVLQYIETINEFITK